MPSRIYPIPGDNAAASQQTMVEIKRIYRERGEQQTGNTTTDYY
jgi:hypothetical protein